VTPDHGRRAVTIWPCDHGGVEVEPAGVPPGMTCAECGANLRQYVDLDALLVFLRAVDWQEGTAADAIEAWVRGAYA
jgi:hypothetical protein